MSWAEVSKVNSDFLEIPLDKRLDLADYKLYGEKSHVFQNKDRLHALYETTGLTMNDLTINGETLEYHIKNNKHIGEAFTSVFDLERKDVFKTLRTMQAVLASSTAMQAVLASSTAILSILNSGEYVNEKILTIMGKSKVALNTFKSSESIMIKFNKLSDVLRAKFADEVEKNNINHEYYTSRHIIQSPTLLCEYTNGQGYSSGGAGDVGKSIITLAGESSQQNISVKNKFITDFDYNSGALTSYNYGYPQYCKNVSIICA